MNIAKETKTPVSASPQVYFINKTLSKLTFYDLIGHPFQMCDKVFEILFCCLVSNNGEKMTFSGQSCYFNSIFSRAFSTHITIFHMFAYLSLAAIMQPSLILPSPRYTKILKHRIAANLSATMYTILYIDNSILSPFILRQYS